MVGEGITPVDPAAKIRPDKSLVTANHAWLEVVRVPSNITPKSCGFLVVGREDDDTSRVMHPTSKDGGLSQPTRF